MVILPALPGLEVTTAVAGEALPEYEHDITDANEPLPSAIAKCIEAPAGAEFEIRYIYKPPYNTLIAQLDVVMDGNYIQAPYVEWGGKEGCGGYKCRRATFFSDEGL
jgi:hypothetical protein